jgi:hypothetical protein
MSQSPPRFTFRSVVALAATLAFTWGGAAQAQTFQSGIIDNFAAPTEPVSPSTGVLTWIANNYAFPGSRPYDDATANRWFATTFSGLTRRGPICGATLRMQVRYLGSNDTMGLWFTAPNGTAAAPGWGATLTSLGLPLGGAGTISLNLASLPGGTNLLPTLNAQGFLDVVVQDDSAVDYITLVITQCRVDVYSKDNAADIGNTPTVDPIWISPDIRVCQNAGCVGHQNPEFGQTNYVYVTLRNSGPNAPVGNPATGTLMVYYTGSGGAAVWPNDWAPIGTLTNVNIAPGATQEFMVPWNNVPAPGHYCLLTRWVAPTTDPMTLAEVNGSNTLNNTRWNNNLAWKNINVVNLNLATPVRDFDFRLRNLLKDRHGEAMLEVRVPADSKGNFLERGQLFITLEPALWERWGREGEGFEIVGEGVVRIVNPGGAKLLGLQLDPDGAHHVTARFQIEPDGATEQGQFAVDLVQHSASQESPEQIAESGGVRFDINVGQNPDGTEPK